MDSLVIFFSLFLIFYFKFFNGLMGTPMYNYLALKTCDDDGGVLLAVSMVVNVVGERR